ncbi:heme A synthase [Yoonia sp. MH D7]
MATKPRSIFEEVGDVQKQVAKPGGIDAKGRGARGAIRIWLGLIFALVGIMILVGGLTRLTDSGLSITEWAPFAGAMPPTTDVAWAEAFDRYRQIPQYELQNKGMELSEFKAIFWWEWGHRQLGRVIGLVWAVGFIGFLVARKIPTGWTRKLLFIGVLGGLQGAIGWWMVTSGLKEGMLAVASYRLATHLGLAFVIFGFIAWYILQLSRTESALMQSRRFGDSRLARLGKWLVALTFLQILLGALVAGIDAGRGYPDWPLMAGGFMPPQPFDLVPLWRNFFEDPGLVQFMHRMAGYVVFAFGIYVWAKARKNGNTRTRFAFNAMLGAMTLQVVLGIVTVIYSAPAHIAIVHQLGAVVLWVVILRAAFLAGHPHPQSVRG